MTQHIEQATRNLLSASECKRFQATRSVKKQREFLLSRALMRHALSQRFLIPENEWVFIEHPNSLPEIVNLPEEIYLSLSHKHGFICFALSRFPVGIDLEASDKHRNFLALAQAFMHEEELNCLKQYTDQKADYFYRIWCAKEAYFKAMPTAEQAKLSFTQISIPALIEDNRDWFLLESKNSNLTLSIMSKYKLSIYPSNFPSITPTLFEEFNIISTL